MRGARPDVAVAALGVSFRSGIGGSSAKNGFILLYSFKGCAGLPILTVIPGRAPWREPGIQRSRLLLDSGFDREGRAPRNDRVGGLSGFPLARKCSKTRPHSRRSVNHHRQAVFMRIAMIGAG